ncbi:hypothetical protein SCAR479_06715 [Seiridium cardinale]|uniref:Uncharacterized protein n=1 Tax=Seiridium cardinale TaxID=138064 RepID=A0ABR2XS78_9PEZI
MRISSDSAWKATRGVQAHSGTIFSFEPVLPPLSSSDVDGPHETLTRAPFPGPFRIYHVGAAAVTVKDSRSTECRSAASNLTWQKKKLLSMPHKSITRHDLVRKIGRGPPSVPSAPVPAPAVRVLQNTDAHPTATKGDTSADRVGLASHSRTRYLC